MDIVNDFLGVFETYLECVEIFLSYLFNDSLVIYGFPWWQWVVGGSFLLALGGILLSKIFR